MTPNKRINTIIILTLVNSILFSCHSKSHDFWYDKYYDRYTFEQLKTICFKDTSNINYYGDSGKLEHQFLTNNIEELLTDLKDDWKQPDSLFPLQPFDKIKTSKSPWEWSQTLTNSQRNQLLSIITDPTLFDWEEPTGEPISIFEFYQNGKLIQTISVGRDSSEILVGEKWPRFKKMKFGHLNSAGQKELKDLLKDIAL